MGNAQSSPPKSSRRSKKKKQADTATDKAKNVFGDLTKGVQASMKKIEDNPFIDAVCGTLMDEKDVRSGRSNSYAYSEDMSEDSRTISEDDTLDEYDRRRKGGKKTAPSESESLLSEFDTVDTVSEASKKKHSKRRGHRDSHEDSESFMSEESSFIDSKSKGVVTESTPEVGLSKPLASSFAKRCYFTKAGIGKTTQHYEGLTLTGNVVLMLAGAMKLKGCPTICDEDLRRVEQTYPNQFSRLPDELLLSSGWRRISKYCHFSNKPIPDGVPFFHSKQRIHPAGGYYFLLAAAVGMIRPIEVEPLTRDTLVLLETDYPTQCDAAPDVLIEDPRQWTLVDKFCFFSGGPINTEEDVYYQADFDGNLIFMLAFLSPSLTPEELYKLGPAYDSEPGLRSVAAVQEVESVYDLTDRDFDDLKLYHLGPCRALPPYILQPGAWTKVLPPHFLAAKQEAMVRAQEYEQARGILSPAATSTGADQTVNSSGAAVGTIATGDAVLPQLPPELAETPPLPEDESYYPPAQEAAPMRAEDDTYASRSQYPPESMSEATPYSQDQSYDHEPQKAKGSHFVGPDGSFLREMEEEGAFIDSTVPIDEAIDARRRNRVPRHARGQPRRDPGSLASGFVSESEAGTSYAGSSYVDPTPADEPPSLSNHDGPEDERGFQDDYTEPSRDKYYGPDRKPYDAENRSPAGAPNGYYHDGEYFQSNSRETGGSSEYYEREEEYYDSPEKGHLRVHTALEQHGDYGQSPDPGSHPGFIYSQESGSETSGGHGSYRHEDAGYDDSQGDQAYSPRTEGESFDGSPDAKHQADERDFASPDDESYEPVEHHHKRHLVEEDYHRTSPPRAEKAPEPEHRPSQSLSAFRSSRPNSILSPQSEYSMADSTSVSEYSQTSAMRGAQELLRKNRQKRLEMAMKKHKAASGSNLMTSPVGRKTDDDETSAATSFVSGSSVWTDTSGAQDRGSRRALILQMAKARMKKGREEEGQAAPIAEVPSIDETGSEQESKATAPTKASDLELARDLD
jgi:hypothetical protein